MPSKKYATDTGTLSFPHLAEPQEVSNPSYTGYSCSIIFSRDDVEKYQWIVDLCKSLASEDSRTKDKTNLRMPYSTDEDSITIKFKRKTDYGAPKCVDKSKAPLSSEEISERLYGGSQVRIAFSPYAYSNQSSGVGLALEAVQLIGDGERIATSNPSDVFETIGPDSIDEIF